MRLHSLAMAAAAFVALALPCTAADGPETKRDDRASEKLGIRLSLQCYTFRALTFFEAADEGRKMGIRYLEIYPGQKLKPGSDVIVAKDMSPETMTEIKKKLAENRQQLVAYGVDGVATDEAGARKEFEWAKAMGIKVLVTETTPTAVHDKLCTEFHIRMALHNHPQSWPPEQVLAATQDRVKLIGSCSDTGHWVRRELVPVEQMKKLEGRIEHLHFKDLNKVGGDAHDVPWGTGVSDAKGMLAELKRQHYKGYMSIEYEVGSVPELESNLPQCVAFFDKTMKELSK